MSQETVADFMSRTPYRFYLVKTIARHTGLSPATVRRQLKKLDAECKVNSDLDVSLFGRTVRKWYWCEEAAR